ncbi:carbohydrate sulfotransferase 2-like [Tubulanus polymorphus]|uniref:carbohydrate sulfotransferase 2-like n=1 Tax=Tubulanus polymorphus TaxID=672921 RepID=UPI003DA306CE
MYRTIDKNLDLIDGILDRLLNCNFNDPTVPKEIFSHPFIEYSSYTKRYGECFSRSPYKMISNASNYCYSLLNNKRLNCRSPWGMCQTFLKETRQAKGNPAPLWDPVYKESFSKWYKCMKPLYDTDLVEKCLDESGLTAKCERSKIRAVKLIRAKMATMRHLAEKHPDWLFIYLVRDPRGTVISRSRFIEYTSDFDYVQEAMFLCTKMQQDIEVFEQIRRIYPDRFLLLKYENFAEDPIDGAKKIYRFMNQSLPATVADQLYKMSHSVKQSVSNLGTYKHNSTQVAHAWQTRMKLSEVKQINNYCNGIYKKLEYTEYGV